MTERELVAAYQSGQVSRRTFIRRLLASGISLAAAMTYADLLWGEAALGTPMDDFYIVPDAAGTFAYVDVADFAFVPNYVMIAQGTNVHWRFVNPFPGTQHAVDGVGFFDSGFRPQHGYDTTWTRQFPAAGIYRYRCPAVDHPLMEGLVEVPLLIVPRKGPDGSRFNVIWSSEADLDGEDSKYVFDVQVDRPHRKWKFWQQGTPEASGEFRARKEGRYRFRSRLRRLSDGAVSDWSRPKSFKST